MGTAWYAVYLQLNEGEVKMIEQIEEILRGYQGLELHIATQQGFNKLAQALLALFVKILKEAMPEKKLFAGRYELIEPLSEKYDEIALMCGYNQTLADLKQNLKKVGIEI